MDTAITWCRDNGWPNDLLQACHFYPSIGSVFYLDDEGGPTGKIDIYNNNMIYIWYLCGLLYINY